MRVLCGRRRVGWLRARVGEKHIHKRTHAHTNAHTRARVGEKHIHKRTHAYTNAHTDRQLRARVGEAVSGKDKEGGQR